MTGVVNLSAVRTYFVDVIDLFFFQAEDGIRDVAVTGVQTCALPIYLTLTNSGVLTVNNNSDFTLNGGGNFLQNGTGTAFTGSDVTTAGGNITWNDQIGRASCRERV